MDTLDFSFGENCLGFVTLKGAHYSEPVSFNGILSILCLKYLNWHTKIPLCWRYLKIRYLNYNYGSVLDVSNVIHMFDQPSW